MRLPTRKASMMATADPRRWKVTARQSGDGTVIFFTGHVKKAATADVVFGHQLDRIVDQYDEGTIYLDFRKVEFLTAADIGRLVSLWKKMKDDGRRLVVCNAKPLVYQVFQVIRLKKLMEIRGERPSFCASSEA
jgi:anti-anti-sigma factor